MVASPVWLHTRPDLIWLTVVRLTPNRAASTCWYSLDSRIVHTASMVSFACEWDSPAALRFFLTISFMLSMCEPSQ